MAGAASWSFSENDFKQIQQHLLAFLRDSNARCALLVDRTGQLVATVGDAPQFDSAAFASLTAADFSANDQLAKMIGEHGCASLVHQGQKESMFLADVAKRVILVGLFDKRTTLGLVKLKGKGAVESLTKIFEEMFNRVGAGPGGQAGPGGTPQKGLLEGAEDEIDKLFG
ncbi:MAG: dynein regulation protein LC7 [Gemmatimonadetes bacterium]|nr:MAG: dynein regulation protein LC7 [Gemmatimonadota bacterium]